MTLLLVADTNLLFECKTLKEIDWQMIGVDRITILLTKPVLDEIDKHKKANGRTRNRAIDTFNLIRGMVTGSTNAVVIRASQPRVELTYWPNLTPDPDHRDLLDYTSNDDRLIGIVSILYKEEETRNVRLLTHDTGPAATAKGLGLPVTMIDDSWLRPLAETNDGKRIRELEAQLSLLQSQEPKIEIRLSSPADTANNVVVTRRVADPLTPSEIQQLVILLQERHPMQAAFPLVLPSPTVLPNGDTIRYEQPADNEVTKYQQNTYPQWIEQCRRVFSKLHEGRDQMEPPVILEWSMANAGARPATQVRIEFEAQGPLALLRILDEDDLDDREKDEQVAVSGDATPPARLPSPPSAPQPTKIVKAAPPKPVNIRRTSDVRSIPGPSQQLLADINRSGAALRMAGLFGPGGLSNATRHLEEINQASRIFDQHRALFQEPGSALAFGQPGTGTALAPSIELYRVPKPFIPPVHEPEAFYYDWAARDPVTMGALTCDLWRHLGKPKTFDFEVLFTKDDEVGGSVLCTVHADNLTVPQTARVKIRRSVEHFSLLDLAQSLIAKCT